MIVIVLKLILEWWFLGECELIVLFDEVGCGVFVGLVVVGVVVMDVLGV